ncbi:MAG: aldehyde ferredoxin oxidoreductase N-terminal domain-containing protein [Desulfobacterales bacterium]|nr:aldehyde ferredoxin oxidoreductase N-terminal domain-containing protein [Desulfobacterales bacterium]
MPPGPGYAGKIARVDLTSKKVVHIPTENYTEAFIGGQGIAARIYWEEVLPEVGAFDPENRLIFLTGPCAGFEGLSGCRWVACGKSPAASPHFFSHCNLGGTWGVELKAAGFDGLVIQGRAERPVYIQVEDGKIALADASRLWGRSSVLVREMIKKELGDAFKVVAVGPAGEKLMPMATLLADSDSSGSGGLGAVMGAKNLKAIAVRGSGVVQAARPRELKKLLDYVAVLQKDAPEHQRETERGGRIDLCSGCVVECIRRVYEAEDGQTGKFMCQSSLFYRPWAAKYYKDPPPAEVLFQATRLCDHYGLDTKFMATSIAWLSLCFHAGVLKEEDTLLPLSEIGSLKFIQTLTADIINGRGLGRELARGIHHAAAAAGERAAKLLHEKMTLTKSGESMSYNPRTFITTALLYAMDPRQPIQQLHEVSRITRPWMDWVKKKPGAHLSTSVLRAIAKKFWASELAVDYSTYEGKALAAKIIQDRQLARECLIICDHYTPILYVEHSPDHVGDPSVDSQIISAVTGRDLSENDLYRVGERLANLQHALLVREGHRGENGDVLPEACFTLPLLEERLNPDVLLPGKNGEIVSRKGAVVDRVQFQNMLKELYGYRNWDTETGLQKKSQLENLGLQDVAADLAARGLLKG